MREPYTIVDGVIMPTDESDTYYQLLEGACKEIGWEDELNIPAEIINKVQQLWRSRIVPDESGESLR